MKIAIRNRKLAACDFDESIPALLQRIFAGRGLTTNGDLESSLDGLHRVEDLSGIDAAVRLLIEALENHWKILIVADFDADGATSCAVGMRGLSAMGARDVSYIVPNRFEYGYGLTCEIVELAMQQSPDLLVTVDNGISSIEGVAAARKAGIKVLITDHHLPAECLPEANAIVNPNLVGDKFPSKSLAGVGVMFYVLLALRAGLRERQWFERNKLDFPNLAELLDLVAVGTIADVVPLDANNRRLTAQGLKRIRAGKTVPGITALIRVAGADQQTLSSSDVGFAIAPRLNAAGRLADMSLGIECLISDDPQRCRQLADQLNELNIARREIEREMKNEALALVDRLSVDETSLPAGVALYDPSWHQGVVGIVASRVKDRFHRPVIAFAPDGAGGLKGSGRSIPGLHLRDLLDAIAKRYPRLLWKFGGHAMAAGVSIAEHAYQDFADAFAAQAALSIDITTLDRIIETDGGLAERELEIGVAEMLKTAAPWGQMFPAPVFDNEFQIVSRRIVGDNHVKLKVRLRDGTKIIDAIAFNASDQAWAVDAEFVHAVYRIETNEFRDLVSLQLLFEYARSI